jgi:hypothetical protein
MECVRPSSSRVACAAEGVPAMRGVGTHLKARGRQSLAARVCLTEYLVITPQLWQLC